MLLDLADFLLDCGLRTTGYGLLQQRKDGKITHDSWNY